MEKYRALILEALFPTHCVICDVDGIWCCESCLGKMELPRIDPCARCGSLKREHECTEVSQVLDGLVALGFYHDPRLRALIHGLKYQNGICLLPSLKELVGRMKNERGNPWPWAGEPNLAIQAVVGSSDRVRARGFDQAELIRDLIKEELVPWAQTVDLLMRGKSVQPQADIVPGPLRTANVKNVFALKQGQKIPLTVLLIDDVFTTGSTMYEAARVLRSAGVEKVYGFVLAMGK